MNICYLSFDDKLHVFPRVTVPMIFAAAAEGTNSPALLEWLDQGGVLDAPVGLVQLRALHQLARSGRYVPGPRGCDQILDTSTVIEEGGDCDNWAAVVLAALRTLGYPSRLSAFGDALDPHEHVTAAAWFGGAWRYLDAKPDQGGSDFLVRPPGRETVYLVR